MPDPELNQSYTRRFYFDIPEAADEYLLSDLASDAFAMFDAKISDLQNPEEVVDVLIIMRGAGHGRDMYHIVNELESRHILNLLEMPAFFESLT